MQGLELTTFRSWISPALYQLSYSCSRGFYSPEKIISHLPEVLNSRLLYLRIQLWRDGMGTWAGVWGRAWAIFFRGGGRFDRTTTTMVTFQSNNDDNNEILIKREPLIYTRARRAVQKNKTGKEKKHLDWDNTSKIKQKNLSSNGNNKRIQGQCAQQTQPTSHTHTHTPTHTHTHRVSYLVGILSRVSHKGLHHG